VPAEQQTCSPTVRDEHSVLLGLYVVNSAGVIPHSDARVVPIMRNIRGSVMVQKIVSTYMYPLKQLEQSNK
jgi:hypothetical protein